jgi:hypothetical protein
MSRLSKQSIRKLCEGIDPLIVPFQATKVRINGKSGGLSHASYDCHIGADLTLGVHPGFIIAAHVKETVEEWHPRWKALLRDGDHGEPSVRAALRRDGVGAENSAYGQSYAQCLREA